VCFNTFGSEAHSQKKMNRIVLIFKDSLFRPETQLNDTIVAFWTASDKDKLPYAFEITRLVLERDAVVLTIKNKDTFKQLRELLITGEFRDDIEIVKESMRAFLKSSLT